MSEQSRMTPPSEGRRERHPLTQEERDVREINALRARAESAERERDELQALCDKLSNLLKRTAIALRGPEPELEMWSWSDLPERITAQLTEAERAQQALQAALDAASRRHHQHYHTVYDEDSAEIRPIYEACNEDVCVADRALTGAPSEKESTK